MFNADFFPTPTDIMERMTAGINLDGKTILEPSAGKGNIVDFCAGSGAAAIACELDTDLQKILQTKCKIIAPDFLTVTSDQISHIDAIIMNPPFSRGAEHLLHAYSIAPKGCKIVCLLNASTLANDYTNARKELKNIIESYGQSENLGDCFSQAERKTGVEVVMVTINKPGQSYQSEFEGFFMGEEIEEETGSGLMPYNVVRDLVNRYVAAVKLYDEQLSTGAKMNSLLNGFYGEGLSFSCTENGMPKLRNEFKKDMQKAGWKFVFAKMNMQKYATRGLKEDINKFVEQQTEIPFTMRNIYHMLQVVVGTQGQRMDKALLEVFDKLTEHHHDNRLNIEGWKTNSHYLVNKKFILPHVCYQDQRWYKGESQMKMEYRTELIEDFIKALCYLTGEDFNKYGSLYEWCRSRWKVVTAKDVFYFSDYGSLYNSVAAKRKELYEQGIENEIIDCEPVYGEWFDFGFFRCKGFKKGSMHFEFKSDELHGKFNQHIARLKGYPLFEGKKQTAYQERQTGRAKQKKAPWVPTVLFEKKVA